MSPLLLKIQSKRTDLRKLIYSEGIEFILAAGTLGTLSRCLSSKHLVNNAVVCNRCALPVTTFRFLGKGLKDTIVSQTTAQTRCRPKLERS